MDLVELERHFAIPGVLRFEQAEPGLVRAEITAPAAAATLYLHGAHLTHWQPTGEAPALFLSPRSEFAAGKAIRGGVPVIFPWFGERSDGRPGPQHGFARISAWELAFAALSGDELHLAFTLAPNQLSRSLGFDHFRLSYRVTIGSTLTLELTVANDSRTPLMFEEALHTYLAVADARQVSIDGLGNVEYIDKADDLKQKLQPAGPFGFGGRTDRRYIDTETTCALDDLAGARRIVIAKSDSRTTVVWNPWDELSAKMPDLGPGAWLHMACIETANVGESAITLAPGATHSMRAIYSIEKTTE